MFIAWDTLDIKEALVNLKNLIKTSLLRQGIVNINTHNNISFHVKTDLCLHESFQWLVDQESRHTWRLLWGGTIYNAARQLSRWEVRPNTPCPNTVWVRIQIALWNVYRPLSTGYECKSFLNKFVFTHSNHHCVGANNEDSDQTVARWRF